MKSDNILLAGIIGLNVSDANHAVFMAEVTREIKDMHGFLIFCRQEKGGVEYATKMERLDILAERYKNIEEDQELSGIYDRGEAYAKAIAAKVKQVRTLVADANCGFRDIKLEGALFFEVKELLSLAAVGSTQGVIEFSKTHRLAGEIYKNEMKKIKQRRKPKQIAAKTQKLLEELK